MPDENIAPSPFTTTQRTAESPAAASSACPRSAISSALKALRFSARLRMRWRTAPRSSAATSDI